MKYKLPVIGAVLGGIWGFISNMSEPAVRYGLFGQTHYFVENMDSFAAPYFAALVYLPSYLTSLILYFLGPLITSHGHCGQHLCQIFRIILLLFWMLVVQFIAPILVGVFIGFLVGLIIMMLASKRGGRGR